MNAEIIERSASTWSENPEQARVAPIVKARVADGAVVLESGPFSWQCDLPPALGGGNTGPSPTAQLLGALAGCAVVFIRNVLAPQLGTRIDSIEAQAGCKADLRGLLGMPGAAPALEDVALTIRIQSPNDAADLRRLHDTWLERCPVYLALAGAVPVGVELDHRG